MSVRSDTRGPGALDLRALPTAPSGRSAPEIWGVAGLVTIEAIVFIGAVASYFHLRLQNPAWPPAGIEDPEVLLPTLNTVLLALTAIPAWLAVRGLRKGDTGTARWLLPVGMLMLVVFIGLKVYEYSHKPWGATSHAYGSMVMLMTGLHLAHVGAVVLKTGVVFSYIRSGRIDPGRPAPLEGNALYWYFVILIWLPLYATIYLSPHVLP
jgi:cytochrome c oxidase subunit III